MNTSTSIIKCWWRKHPLQCSRHTCTDHHNVSLPLAFVGVLHQRICLFAGNVLLIYFLSKVSSLLALRLHNYVESWKLTFVGVLHQQIWDPQPYQTTSATKSKVNSHHVMRELLCLHWFSSQIAEVMHWWRTPTRGGAVLRCLVRRTTITTAVACLIDECSPLHQVA